MTHIKTSTIVPAFRQPAELHQTLGSALPQSVPLDVVDASMSDLRIDRITNVAQFRALIPEWQALAKRIFPRLPFADPIWNLLWWEHYAENTFARRDTLELRIVRDANGTVIAVAPLMLTERPAVGPVRTRMLQFLGADSNVTELRGVVCAQESRKTVYAALVRHLRDAQREWDVMRFTGIPMAVACEQIFRGQKTRILREAPDYFLPLPESWDAFRATLPRNTKEALRKSTNAPKRHNIVFTLRVVTEVNMVLTELDTFFELHRARAKARSSVVHADTFKHKRSRCFLRSLVAAAPADGIRLYELMHADKVVATRLTFVLGNELYLYFSGYDLAYAKYSVMTACMSEIIRDAIRSRFQWLNLSLGTDYSKTRWRPLQTAFRDVDWVSPTWRGRLLHQGIRLFSRYGQ